MARRRNNSTHVIFDNGIVTIRARNNNPDSLEGSFLTFIRDTPTFDFNVVDTEETNVL